MRVLGLFLLSLFIVFVKCENIPNEGLGFVYPANKLMLRKVSSNTMIGINIPAAYNFATLANKLRPVSTKLTAIGKMTVFSDATLGIQVKPVLDKIKETLELLEKSLQDMSNYAIKTLPPYVVRHTCVLNYDEITESYIDTFVAGILALLSKINTNMSLTQFQETDKINFEALTVNLFDARDYTINYENDLIKRLEVMTSLSRYEIPDSLPFMLETLECIALGSIERLGVNYCKRVSSGLFCELEMISSKTREEYIKFATIAYEGAQLRLPDRGQSLLQSATGHWEILECDEDSDYTETEFVEDYLDCRTKLYENKCTENIQTTNYDDILKYCNFTYEQPIEEITRTTEGVLIMGTDINVREVSIVDGSTTSSLPKRLPVYIHSNDKLRISSGDKEIDILPSIPVSQRKILYTNIPTDIISKMQTSARNSDLKDKFTTDRIVSGVILVLVIFMIPLSICYCVELFRNMKWDQCCTREKAGKILNRTRQAVRNYKRNKQYQKDSAEQNY